MAVEGEPAMRLEGRREPRIDQLDERPADDVSLAQAGELDGVTCSDQATERGIDDECRAASEVDQRRGLAIRDAGVGDREEFHGRLAPGTAHLRVEL
ncbi:MAG: hypothetical protein ABIT71_14615 [Vicinamibacteraceae bacterium]